MLKQETLKMVIVSRRNGAALLQQMGHREAGVGAGSFKRSRFEAIPIGLVEQLAEQRRKLGRQPELLEFANHAFDG